MVGTHLFLIRDVGKQDPHRCHDGRIEVMTVVPYQIHRFLYPAAACNGWPHGTKIERDTVEPSQQRIREHPFTFGRNAMQPEGFLEQAIRIIRTSFIKRLDGIRPMRPHRRIIAFPGFRPVSELKQMIGRHHVIHLVRYMHGTVCITCEPVPEFFCQCPLSKAHSEHPSYGLQDFLLSQQPKKASVIFRIKESLSKVFSKVRPQERRSGESAESSGILSMKSSSQFPQP